MDLQVPNCCTLELIFMLSSFVALPPHPSLFPAKYITVEASAAGSHFLPLFLFLFLLSLLPFLVFLISFSPSSSIPPPPPSLRHISHLFHSVLFFLVFLVSFPVSSSSSFSPSCASFLSLLLLFPLQLFPVSFSSGFFSSMFPIE